VICKPCLVKWKDFYHVNLLSIQTFIPIGIHLPANVNKAGLKNKVIEWKTLQSYMPFPEHCQLFPHPTTDSSECGSRGTQSSLDWQLVNTAMRKGFNDPPRSQTNHNVLFISNEERVCHSVLVCCLWTSTMIHFVSFKGQCVVGSNLQNPLISKSCLT